MNTKLKNLTEEQIKEEYEKCKNSVAYFYNNYCRKEGMPEYSEEAFKEYIESVEQQRNFYKAKNRRKSFSPSFLEQMEFYQENPLPSDKFISNSPTIQNDNYDTNESDYKEEPL